VLLFCDNKSAIKMTQNPVQHSRNEAHWHKTSLHKRPSTKGWY
jgi:hypothetical protein